MSTDSTKSFIKDFQNNSNVCVNCGDDSDLLVAFTAHKVCGKCTRKAHAKAVK